MDAQVELSVDFPGNRYRDRQYKNVSLYCRGKFAKRTVYSDASIDRPWERRPVNISLANLIIKIFTFQQLEDRGIAIPGRNHNIGALLAPVIKLDSHSVIVFHQDFVYPGPVANLPAKLHITFF